jgi:cytochrome c
MHKAASRALCLLAALAASAALAQGDARRGAAAFRACIACHAIEPGVQGSGPSLAGVWGRKAGSLEAFPRFSEPLKRSGIVWDEKALDAWLRDTQALVPGNYMSVPGLRDARARADLIAFLRTAGDDKSPGAAPRTALPDLKRAPQSALVKAIRHCRDTYYVTNGEDRMRPYWEFNLRFKTDASASGPAPGAPVLVSQGMQGDRAQVVFARPGEISSFIREAC